MAKTTKINLGWFTRLFPQQARMFLKTAKGLGIKEIVVPARLLEPQNSGLRTELGKPEFLAKLVDGQGRLDLRRSGLEAKPGYHDLTADFEDYQTLLSLREMFSGKNAEIIVNDPEIAKSVLNYSLLMVLNQLHLAGEKRAAALNDGNATLFCEARTTIIWLAEFVNGTINEYKNESTNNTFKSDLERIVQLLRAENNPAAKLILHKLIDRLEKELAGLERQRLGRSRYSLFDLFALTASGRDLPDVAAKRYGLSKSSDGKWVLPQRGFKKAGPVKQQWLIDHQVAEADLLRREQHRIDEISQDLALNISNTLAFREMAGFLEETPLLVNYEQYLSRIALAQVNYEQAVVRPKVKVKLMLKLAFDLVQTAQNAKEESRERLVSFAAAMLRLSAVQLEQRDQELEKQLVRIFIKKQFLQSLIEPDKLSENTLKIFSILTANGLAQQRVMGSVPLLNELIDLNRQVKLGLEGASPRIKTIFDQLAMIRRLIIEQQARRNRIAALRYDRNLTKQQKIDLAKQELAALAQANGEISATVTACAKEALMIRYDLEHKDNLGDQVAIDEFLTVNLGHFVALGRLNEGYLPVVSRDGQGLGLAHPYDVKVLKLQV